MLMLILMPQSLLLPTCTRVANFRWQHQGQMGPAHQGGSCKEGGVLHLVAYRISSNRGRGAVCYCSVLHITCTKQARVAGLAGARDRSMVQVRPGRVVYFGKAGGKGAGATRGQRKVRQLVVSKVDVGRARPHWWVVI